MVGCNRSNIKSCQRPRTRNAHPEYRSKHRSILVVYRIKLQRAARHLQWTHHSSLETKNVGSHWIQWSLQRFEPCYRADVIFLRTNRLLNWNATLVKLMVFCWIKSAIWLVIHCHLWTINRLNSGIDFCRYCRLVFLSCWIHIFCLFLFWILSDIMEKRFFSYQCNYFFQDVTEMKNKPCTDTLKNLFLYVSTNGI